jgi:ACS family glucarate transporter-like MFS transporter
LLFGAGEAGAFPGCARAYYSWLPLSERGIAQGINFSGSRLGAAASLFFLPWLIGAFGWRASFISLGLIGFVWAVFWYFWFRDDPTHDPRLSPEELKRILEGRQQAGQAEEATEPLTAHTLFGSRNLWLAMWQYICSNFTFFFAITWSFPYLREEFELEPVQAGVYAAFPLIFGAFGNWVSGTMVDRIYRTGRWGLSRRLPAMIGFLLAAVGLVGTQGTDSAFGYALCLSIAIFGADMTLSPSWAFCIDIGRGNAGAVSGTMNMAGNLAAFATSLAFPYLKDWSGSTSPYFLIAATLNVFAIVAWWMMRPERPLEEF